MQVLHQKKCFANAGPTSLKDVWPKYKNKLPVVSDSYQNIGTPCNSKPNFKDTCIKSTEKLVKDEWIYVTQQF